MQFLLVSKDRIVFCGNQQHVTNGTIWYFSNEWPLCFPNTINTAKNIQIINNQVHKMYTKNILRPELPTFPEKWESLFFRWEDPAIWLTGADVASWVTDWVDKQYLLESTEKKVWSSGQI